MGGMQRVSMQLIDALSARRDVELEPVVLHATWKGIGWQTFRFLMRQSVELPAKVRDFGAHAVVFSSMVTAALAPLVRSRIGAAMVAINHGRDVTLPVAAYQGYLPRVFRSLDATVSVSSATRVECLKRGMAPSKAFVLPNGFPLAKIKASMDRAQAAALVSEAAGVPVEGKVMLTVGRQVKRKGHLWFLREVLPKVQTPSTWLVAGDGPEHAELLAEAAHAAGRHRVVLLGRVDEELLEAAYLASDLFVMPNIPVPGDMEGFGVVMLEANAKGLPVVATNLEGITDVVLEGENGHLVEPLRPKAFAARVDAMLAGPPVFGAEGLRRYVESRFGWDSIAGRYVELIRGLASVSPRVTVPHLIDQNI